VDVPVSAALKQKMVKRSERRIALYLLIPSVI